MARRKRRSPGPGMAKARRAPLCCGSLERALSRHAEEVLFAHAELMSEGSARDAAGGASSYFGSTMITIDLGSLRGALRGAEDPGTHEHIRALVEGSVRMRLRAMRLACAEAARRLPDRPLGTPLVETRVHLVRGKLHLDVDLEVPFDVSSQRGQR